MENGGSQSLQDWYTTERLRPANWSDEAAGLQTPVLKQPPMRAYVLVRPPPAGATPSANPGLLAGVTIASFRSAESGSNQRPEAGETLPVPMSMLLAWHRQGP